MINLKIPENIILKPIITVLGVGGAGGNAVNNMIASGLQGVRFVVANTDAQALENSAAENRIQLGVTTTRGLGAGADREVGMSAAEESRDDIISYLEGSNMVFITAGMGGGTGTGAAPTVAKLAKEMGILTVGVVTKPFHFEGAHRMKTADSGLAELQQYVDTLIVIPNQNLFRIANERTTFTEAFKTADEVLKKGVQSITDLMIMPGLINLDFADISAVMGNMGKAMMGTGEADGEDRAVRAAEAAISNPLLDQSSMRGAKGVLINITGGDMTLFEVDAAANRIREEVGNPNANIIFGSTFDEKLQGVIRVSVVATGIGSEDMHHYGTTHHHNTHQEDEDEVVIAVEEVEVEPEVFAAVMDTIIPEEEAQSFEEYGITETEEQEFDDSIYAAAPVTTTSQNASHTPKKSSIFSRMWESLRGMDQTQEDSHQNKRAPQHSAQDLYDTPAFLRKRK
ncbi:MAG: cell division protein FtsZ [Rickettsiaceae bacterium]|nr:cell division protein FtsZ [Rickettsiaceae bacterium]